VIGYASATFVLFVAMVYLVARPWLVSPVTAAAVTEPEAAEPETAAEAAEPTATGADQDPRAAVEAAIAARKRALVQPRCRACGAAVDHDDRFCRGCGASLGGAVT
jgi:Na+-transporting methylmalonyl-CoA/oxaloacetate decarboxylase gamma subunit